jgi:hypothetical protein
MLDTRITAVLVLPMVHVFSTQTVAEFYRRRSTANLDKSGMKYHRSVTIQTDACTRGRSVWRVS